MIEFQCPGCLHFHVANAAFAGLRARCVVCGVAIRIPAKGGAQAQLVEEPGAPLRLGARPRLAPPASARSGGPPRPSRPMADPSVEPDVDFEVEESLDADIFGLEAPSGDAPARAPGAAAKRAATARGRDPGREAAEDADEIDLADSEAHAPEVEVADPKPMRPEPPLPAVDPEGRRKQKIRLGIAGGLAVVIVLCGVFFLSGNKPKPAAPPSKSSSVDDFVDKPPAQPPPPPPKPPEKKVEPPKAILPEATPPHLAGPPITFAASLLVADRAAAPQVFDKNLEGRRVIVQGMMARFERDTLILGDSAEEAKGAISCEMRKWELAELKWTLANGSKLPLHLCEVPREELVEFKTRPGQAVVVSGVYAKNLRLIDCEVLRATSPTDEEFKDRVVEVTGMVQQVQKDGGTAERFPTIFLTPPTTDPLISVRCLFRLTESEKVGAIKVGQTITVRGKCEGRLFRVIRFHDCSLADPADPPTPGLVRVAADKFFAAYESDLLPVPRPGPSAIPVKATAEQLAEVFAGDPIHANNTYRHKLVEVTGKMLSRGTNTAILETGTGHRFQMELVFLPAKFAQLREEATLTVRGVCAGVRGGYIRFENCERYDAQLGDATVRTTAEYFPLTSREMVYDVLTPRGPRDNPITRFSVKFTDSDFVRTAPLRTGTFPRATLFDTVGQPKWSASAKLANPTVTQVRMNEGTIEIREKPAPPTQPGQWWDPVFKVGMRRGEKWISTMPDGATVTYTVGSFGKDSQGRQTVEINRVFKSGKELKDAKDTLWDEATVTYALGVGEVRRVITRQTSNGRGFTLLEMRLVEGETPELKTDPKKEPNPANAGKNEAKKDDK